MGKKIYKELPPDGAPAYMGLYAGLMTILFSFFILLNTLNKQQEAGFKSGMGKIRNAFGLKGGFGLLNYMQMVRGRSNVESEEEAKPGELAGTPKDITLGQGGSGNVDQDADKFKLNRYVQVRLNFDFPKGSSDLTPELRSFLEKIATTLQVFNYAIAVKCVAADSGDPVRDLELANKRAFKIMLYLHHQGNIPVNRIQAVGLTSPVYLSSPAHIIPLSKNHQANVLCIFRSPKSMLK
ncbi:MAG: hypothetical protein D6820_10340 [Lentisphaerae bacterium]|nr:MAG: hypothetical protein D6820_10340 [Lentisphaerota bacterium]